MKPTPLTTPLPLGWNAFILAENQPEYLPLPIHREPDLIMVEGIQQMSSGRCRSQWRLTWRERLAVLLGADIQLTLMMFGKPVTPVRLDVTGFSQE